MRDVIVPVAVKGIEEVVIKHTRTKRGTIRTTETIIPIVRPPKEKKAGQTSRSRKKGNQAQSQPAKPDRSGGGGGVPTIDNTQTDQYIDEDLYEDLEAPPDTRQPQACAVWNRVH